MGEIARLVEGVPNRVLAIEYVTLKMIDEFSKGHDQKARDLETLLTYIEGMEDQEFDRG